MAVRRALVIPVLVMAGLATLATGQAILGLTGPPPSFLPVDPPAAASGSSIDPHPAPTAFEFRSSDGYTLTVPDGWTASSVSGQEQAVLVDVIEGSNPDLADLIREALDRTGATVSMVGGNITALSDQGVPPHVTILRMPIPDGRLEAAAASAQSVIASIANVTVTEPASAISLPSGRAMRFAWVVRARGTRPAVRLETYVIQQGTTAYLLTCGAAEERFGAERATFDRLLRSFRPTP